MRMRIILTSNYPVLGELLMKRKDKFIEKFMASQSLLDYFNVIIIIMKMYIVQKYTEKNEK